VRLPGAQALFTTRRGGTSRGPYESLNLGLKTADSREAVIANRARLSGELRLRLSFVRQVHGRRVVRAPQDTEQTSELPEADGQTTVAPGVGLAMLAADCLPIAVASQGAVAALHAGWRGLAGGVIEAGVRALQVLDSREPLHAAIGPGAGPCCYEVGEEVHAAFADRWPESRRGRNLDLKAIARAQLFEAGASVVHDAGLCTICSDPSLFFSHRRDSGITGRQAGIVWRTLGDA
jgi:purine-nucleoside/S-methyl-5'-thioadenosine phosphorylase / adenosine deaminase